MMIYTTAMGECVYCKMCSHDHEGAQWGSSSTVMCYNNSIMIYSKEDDKYV